MTYNNLDYAIQSFTLIYEKCFDERCNFWNTEEYNCDIVQKIIIIVRKGSRVMNQMP